MATKTKTQARRKAKVQPLTDRERLKQLRAFVVLCLGGMEQETDGDLKEIANLTGLSLGTIYRVRDPRNVSLKMHFGTVQLLGAGAGLELVLTQYQVAVRVVRR